VSSSPFTVFDLAIEYINLGWQPVPIPYREKGPTLPDWTNLRITHETAPQYFNGIPQNIGIILGEASKGLVDIDIDCPEALALAPYFLPATSGRFGRASKRASHWLYFSNVPKHQKFEDPNGGTIVELRTGGVQTVFPGSHHVSGEFIDFEDGCDVTKIPVVDAKKLEEAVKKLAAACLLARYFPAKGRHDFCLALGGGLLQEGWTPEHAELFVYLVAWAGGSDNPKARSASVTGTKEKMDAGENVTRWGKVKDLIKDRPLGGGVGGEKLVKKIRKWLAPVQPSLPTDTEKIAITIGFDELEIADQMLSPIAKLPNVFKRGWKLVQILRDDVKTKEDDIVREPESPRISAIPKERTRALASHVCLFQRWKTGSDGIPKLVQCSVPDDPVNELHKRGEWPGVRYLETVAESPVFRPDGTILDTPGYDRMTGIFYEPNADYPPVPTEPTIDDARSSILTLLDVIDEFPWQTDEHVSAWLALLLTPFARPAIDGPIPFGLLDKNVNGAGAGMLADIIGTVCSGRGLPKIALADETEMRKRILALAISGDSVVLLDNLEGSLNSAVLASTITSGTISERKLGVSEMIPMPMRALWLITAKNLTLSTELIRRALHVRLESFMEHPEDRGGFKYYPLLPHVNKVRPTLVVAVLTILRAYFAAGCPDQKLSSWGSFENWSRIIRGALVWSDMPDPYVGRAELVESGDSEVSVLEKVLVAWEKLGKPTLVSDLLNEIGATAFAHLELKTALAELCECAPEKLTAREVGAKLKKHKKQNVGGRMFDHRPKQGGGTPWFVARIKTP
jgi:hypothetical protein